MTSATTKVTENRLFPTESKGGAIRTAAVDIKISVDPPTSAESLAPLHFPYDDLNGYSGVSG